jgi:hypothetical protein
MCSLRLRVILPTWCKHIIDNAVDAADGTGTLRLATRGASSVERRGGTITINSRRVRSSCGPPPRPAAPASA